MFRKALLVYTLVSLLITIFIFSTCINKFNSSLIGDGGDNLEFLSFMHIAHTNLSSFNLPLSGTDILRYPTGFSFNYGSDGYFSILLGALYMFIFPPVLSYNLVVFSLIFLNILSFLICFHGISKLFKVKTSYIDFKILLSTLIVCLSPYIYARINGHLNLLFIAGFPIFLLSVFRIFIKLRYKIFPSIYDIVLFYVSILVIALGSLQYVLWLFILFPLLLLFVYLSFPAFSDFNLRNVKTSFSSYLYLTFGFILMFYLVFHGYINAIIAKDINLIETVLKFIPPSISDFYIPNRYLGDRFSILNLSLPSIEKVIAVGLVEIMVFLTVFLNKNSKGLKFFYLFILCLHFALSFRLIPLPFIPEGGRFVLFFSLFIALIPWFSNIFSRKSVVYFFIVLLLFQSHLYTVRQHVIDISEPIYSLIKSLPNEAILNVPSQTGLSFTSSLISFHGKKIPDGYFHYTANNLFANEYVERIYELVCGGTSRLDTEYIDVRQKKLKEFLSDYDFGGVMLYKKGKFQHTECKNAIQYWQLINPPYQNLVNTNGEVINKTIVIPHASRLKAELYSPMEGEFTLHGLLVYPPVKDLSFYKFSYSEDRKLVNLLDMPDGSGLSFNPAEFITLSKGESIIFESNSLVDTTIYFTVYYSFTPDLSEETLNLSKPRFFDLIYSDDSYDFYRVNP